MHYPSKPIMATDAPKGPYMPTEEAIAILSSIWTPNVRMWKYRGCQLGDDARGWPPRILAALAVLAQTAGRGNRILAMQMITVAMGNLAYTAPTPEHIARATELLKQQQQQRLHYSQQQQHVNSHAAVANACHVQDAAVPLRSSAASVGISAMDRLRCAGDGEKDKEIAALRAQIAKLEETKVQLKEKHKRVEEVEMERFNMDARLAVVTSDRDMYEMYWDVAEMHRKRLEKEKVEMNASLAVMTSDRDMYELYWNTAETNWRRLEKQNTEIKETLVVKDAIIDKLVRERDEAAGRAMELEHELAALKGI